jgi:hypothetical protein
MFKRDESNQEKRTIRDENDACAVFHPDDHHKFEHAECEGDKRVKERRRPAIQIDTHRILAPQRDDREEDRDREKDLWRMEALSRDQGIDLRKERRKCDALDDAQEREIRACKRVLLTRP